MIAFIALAIPAYLQADGPLPASGPMGTIERKDPRLDQLIAPGAVIEKLATGFLWTEGPVWMGDHLLFSDIPRNTIWRYDAKQGITLFLKPAGFSGKESFTGREPGSNGLARDAEGRLLICEHGDRRVSRLEADGKRIVLADKFQGKRFNSPNDLALHSSGSIYFTDPPYGLPKQTNDPARELDYQGVYRVSHRGEISLLTKELSRPNGIAFSPDEKTLYVANSDPNQAIWMSYPVLANGSLGQGKVFFDATPWAKAKQLGLPDGLKVDAKGNIFATGPGGVQIFNAAGEHLGTLATGVATANCGWGDDGGTLYITADKTLCKIRTLTKGKGF